MPVAPSARVLTAQCSAMSPKASMAPLAAEVHGREEVCDDLPAGGLKGADDAALEAFCGDFSVIHRIDGIVLIDQAVGAILRCANDRQRREGIISAYILAANPSLPSDSRFLPGFLPSGCHTCRYTDTLPGRCWGLPSPY